MPVWNICIDEKCVGLSEDAESLADALSKSYCEIDDDCTIAGKIFLVWKVLKYCSIQ